MIRIFRATTEKDRLLPTGIDEIRDRLGDQVRRPDGMVSEAKNSYIECVRSLSIWRSYTQIAMADEMTSPWVLQAMTVEVRLYRKCIDNPAHARTQAEVMQHD